MIIHHQGFRHALSLIVTAADTDRIHVSPVLLGLRMDMGVPVHFRGRCLKNPCPYPFCESQHVDGAHDACFDGFDRIVLVMNRRCRTCQVINSVDLKQYRLGNVVTNQFESGIAEQRENVPLIPGKEIVEAQNIMPFPDQPFT